MRSPFPLAFALVAACSTPRASSSGPAPAAPGGIQRTLIDRKPATDLPGWETRLYLIEYPPGAAAPLHVHPAIGVGFVIDGRFESAFGDEPVIEVQRGHGFVDQADVPHRVFRNPSPDQALRFVVAYTLRAGDEPLRVVPTATVLRQPALFPEGTIDPSFGFEQWSAMRNPDLFRVVYDAEHATWDGTTLPTTLDA